MVITEEQDWGKGKYRGSKFLKTFQDDLNLKTMFMYYFDLKI